MIDCCRQTVLSIAGGRDYSNCRPTEQRAPLDYFTYRDVPNITLYVITSEYFITYFHYFYLFFADPGGSAL